MSPKRITVKVNKNLLEDYDQLGSKDNKDYLQSPFLIRKDVFMMAVVCGFIKNQKSPLPDKSKDIHELFGTETFDDLDIAILTTIFIKDNAMEINSEIENLGKIVGLAEEYAEEGLKWLKIYIYENDQPNLYSLCDWIENPKWHSKSVNN
jgi:hypothetical protein